MTSTPPWQTDSRNLTADLTADLAKIAQQWSAIREILDDPILFDLRDTTVSVWSCGEHATHVALVAQWISAAIQENLAEPRNTDAEISATGAAVLAAGSLARGVAQSPERADFSRRPQEDALPILTDAEAAWRELAGRVDDIASCLGKFQHFALGFMTCADWVRFAAIHTAHHLKIIRDIQDHSNK